MTKAGRIKRWEVASGRQSRGDRKPQQMPVLSPSTVLSTVGVEVWFGPKDIR